MPAKAFNACVHLRMPSCTLQSIRENRSKEHLLIPKEKETEGTKWTQITTWIQAQRSLHQIEQTPAHLWVCKGEIDVAISINAAIAKTYNKVYFLLHQKSLPIDGGRYYSPKILSVCSHISQC